MIEELKARAVAGARECVQRWLERGCEFASIENGTPLPWPPISIKLMMADAQRRRLEVFCLADPSHVERLTDAIVESLERGLLGPASGLFLN